MLKRTIIKLSGEALAGEQPGQTFNDRVIDSITEQINEVLDKGVQVALVVGGGNFWRGGQARPDINRVKADQIGMLATVMNALYLEEAFKRQGLAAKTVTPIPIGNMTALYEKDNALKMMASGVVVINAAGLGHPFFSTDTVTALRAAELGVDCILYAKNVDGIYNMDPRLHPGAKKYKTLSYSTAICQNLNAADIAAMQLAMEARIPSYMFGLSQKDSIAHACMFPETGPLQGTFIDADAKEDFYE